MKFTKSPETFFVEEIMPVSLNGGKYFYYLLEKRGIDSPNAIRALSGLNKCRVFYSGLKDANASTRQFICSEKELAEPEDDRISIEFLGKSPEKIFVGKHIKNKFKIILESNEGEKFFRDTVKKTVFPNYFDDQRFGKKSLHLAGHLAKGNFEDACKTALTEFEDFETDKSKEIKNKIKENWGKWKELCAMDIPESKKQIFSFLSGGGNFRDAVGLLEPKTVSIACKAGQALEFNKQLSSMIENQKIKGQQFMEISGQKLMVKIKPKGLKRQIKIPPIFPSVRSLERKTFFELEKPKIYLNSGAISFEFILKKGSYATIVVKTLEQILQK